MRRTPANVHTQNFEMPASRKEWVELGCTQLLGSEFRAIVCLSLVRAVYIGADAVSSDPDHTLTKAHDDQT